MTVPLVVLAVLAFASGFGSWHERLLDPATVEAAIESSGAPAGRAVGSVHGHEHHSGVMLFAILAGAVGLGLGALAFVVRLPAIWALRKPLAPLERAFAAKFWFDELYREALLRPAYLVAQFFGWADREGVDGIVNGVGRGAQRTSRGSGAVDRVVVDGAVRGTGAVVLVGGEVLGRAQSGRIRAYIAWGVVFLAAALVAAWLF
jgi:NADH-quinone oxidoreductase subunit L